MWAAGEPAFLKIWLRAPATAALDDALDAEEGFSPDLVAAVIEAQLAACGVDTEGFKRACVVVVRASHTACVWWLQTWGQLCCARVAIKGAGTTSGA